MKIIFLIGAMSSGGAERVVSELSNYWVENNHDVSIVSTHRIEGKNDFYQLDSRIKRIDLTIKKEFKIANKILKLFTLARSIRNLIKKENPTVVISFISTLNILSIISLFASKVPLIISDRDNPTLDRVSFRKKKFFYPLSNALVIQTQEVKKFYESIETLNINVISNPIPPIVLNNEKIMFEFNNKTICSVGRFKLEYKGFDLLVEAFSLIAKDYPDWDLVIFGEGPDRDILEKLIVKKNLQNRISLPGRIDNPRNTIIHADIFVLSSLTEGFPNVLLEAMSVGLPSISFDCNYGPSEIITHNKNALLVPASNVTVLSSEIKRLIEDESLRNSLGKNAKVEISQKYSINSIVQEWEKVILSIQK